MGEPVKFERKNEIQLIPQENLKAVGDQIGELMQYIKVLEEQKEDLRKAMTASMVEYGITKWTTPNGTQFNLIVEEDREVEKFDLETFKKENPALVAKYTKTVTQVGKAPYIRTTLPPKAQ